VKEDFLHYVWQYKKFDFSNLTTVSGEVLTIANCDNTEIPVLELKKYISKKELEKYQSLTSQKSWIYCERQIDTIDYFVFQNWQERLFVERLERKYRPIEQLLKETENNWEAVLFCMLAKNFGLNTNGETFLKIAKSIPFPIIRKESVEVENIESLLFGMADLIPVDAEDNYTKELKKRFYYIIQKHSLKDIITEPVQFFKHRPDNFPTIRLAQLAMLYHKQQNLFSKVIVAKTVKELSQLFDITISDYWQTHYQFDKASPKKKKQFSKSFIDLLVINTIVPIQFAYAKSQGKETSESLIDLLREVAAEKNMIIEKFSNYGIKAKNAFETQSLLQLKNEYCNYGKCLQCAVGIQLLKE